MGNYILLLRNRLLHIILLFCNEYLAKCVIFTTKIILFAIKLKNVKDI